jgi:hypothetical protein
VAPAPRGPEDRQKRRIYWVACGVAALAWVAAVGHWWRGADLAWPLWATMLLAVALGALQSWLFVPEELGQVASALGLRFRPRGLYPFDRHVSRYRGRKLAFWQVSRPTTSFLLLEHPHRLGLGLHCRPERRPIECHDFDLLARALPLDDPAIRCYADADSVAAALVSRPAVKQALDSLDRALPEGVGGFAVCDDGVRISLPAAQPVSAPMIQAMAALGDAVSQGPASARPRPRQLYGLRVLVLALAVPAVILAIAVAAGGLVDGMEADARALLGLSVIVLAAGLCYLWWRLRSRH